MPKVRLKKDWKTQRTVHFRSGVTPHDIMMSFNPESGNWEAPTVCFVNNRPVLRSEWPILRLEKRDVVTFARVPLGGGGGGGSNPLKTVLQVVVAVVATIASVYSYGATSGWAAAAWAAVAAGVSIAGNYLIGQLFPMGAISSGQAGAVFNEQADPTYSLNGSNNIARLEQPIPEGFGRIKIVPDRVTGFYYLYAGNEQYVYQVFMLGYGEYDVEIMYFGDSPFWSKAGGVNSAYDAEVQFCLPGQEVTLFPSNVEISPEVSGQRLYAPNEDEYIGWLGPYSANPPGTSTNRIVINVVFPQGIGRYNDSGALATQSISYTFEYRIIDDWGNPLSAWTILFSRARAMNTLTPQRFSEDVAVASGRYQIRGHRTNSISLDGRTLHMMQWESMQSFLPGSLTYDQSVVAVKVKATNTLSQQAANTFGVVYTRKLPIWNGATRTWSAPQPTRNFAAAVSQILRADYGGNLPDSRIDLEALWFIGFTLEANDWTFDGYFSGPYTVWQVLMEICQPYGVVPRINNGTVSFILDQPDRPARHIFTPENVMRGSLSITYNTFTERTPDDVLVSYLDEAAGFQQRDVQATLPDSKSVAPASRSFIGVVSREQAFRMAVRMAAVNRHRRLEFRWQTEASGRLLALGDVAILNHPFFAVIKSGVLADWDEDSLRLTLDKEVGETEGDIYLGMNSRDGRAWGPCKAASVDGVQVWLDPSDFALIVSQNGDNPFGWPLSNGADAFPTVWSLQSSPDFEGRVIVTNISPVDRFHFEITAINDAPEAYGYQDLPVPIWGYRENGGGDPGGDPNAPLDKPGNMSIALLGTMEAPFYKMTWPPVPGADHYLVQYSFDAGYAGGVANWISAPDVYINTATVPLQSFIHGVFRVAAANSTQRSDWGPAHGFSATPPSGPYMSFWLQWAKAEYKGGGLLVTWRFSEVFGWFDTVYFIAISQTESSRQVYRAELGPSHTAIPYTAAMGAANGGPWRNLTVTMSYGNRAEVVLNVSDPPPTLTGEFNISVGSTSVTLTGAGVEGEYTGFVVARGAFDGFGVGDVLEHRITNALPYTWSGLTPNTVYYFRLAAKDAFSDVTANYLDLNYSAVMQVTTGA